MNVVHITSTRRMQHLSWKAVQTVDAQKQFLRSLCFALRISLSKEYSGGPNAILPFCRTHVAHDKAAQSTIDCFYHGITHWYTQASVCLLFHRHLPSAATRHYGTPPHFSIFVSLASRGQIHRSVTLSCEEGGVWLKDEATGNIVSARATML